MIPREASNTVAMGASIMLGTVDIRGSTRKSLASIFNSRHLNDWGLSGYSYDSRV